jgi:hypothetical protein
MIVRINYNCTLSDLLDGSIQLESILMVLGGEYNFQLKYKKIQYLT